MLRVVLLFLLTSILAGCGSIFHPLPKCDGYSRRPLNRSMWQSEHRNTLSPKMSEAMAGSPEHFATSYADDQGSAAPAAFAWFDAKGSYHPCEGK